MLASDAGNDPVSGLDPEPAFRRVDEAGAAPGVGKDRRMVPVLEPLHRLHGDLLLQISRHQIILSRSALVRNARLHAFAREPFSAKGAAMTEQQPSPRKLVGILLIGGIILLWAAFVASLAPFVGKWPALAQAPYYLFVGVVWVMPLKPLVRWIQTGSFRVPD